MTTPRREADSDGLIPFTLKLAISRKVETVCFLSERYEERSERSAPFKPYLSSLPKRTEWFTQSKALDRSQYIAPTHYDPSKAPNTAPMTSLTALEVENPFLKPN
ncbi:hypothetical protein J6590_019406 [Homalodisca vitripennis]|nr:hypothetical protein J6590_019406 [Homalodisca vitripennis]